MKTIGVLTSGGDAPGMHAAICASVHGFDVGADPTRVAAQVVTGIGFLGGGHDSAPARECSWVNDSSQFVGHDGDGPRCRGRHGVHVN